MDGSRAWDGQAGSVVVVMKPPEEEEVASGAGGEAECDGTEEEEGPTEAQPPVRVGGDSVDDGSGCSAFADEMLAQLPFLKPDGLDSVDEEAAGAIATVLVFATFTPAAAAILRSSFSSRFRSFSLRLSCSSAVFCLARWVFCISRKRILWWCAYELVCSSYWATFWNCFSQTVQ
jgi:hypothetical protein